MPPRAYAVRRPFATPNDDAPRRGARTAPRPPALLLPGRVWHGCIRLCNGDVSWLARHLTFGTPVLIR
jgi:hypothetical protein